MAKKKNELFSGNIDKIIEEEIISKFAFTCKLLKSKNGNSTKLYLGFLPHGTLSSLSKSGKLSETEMEIISKNYKLFSDYFIEKLDVQPMLKERYKEIRPSQCKDFENTISITMKLYEDENRIKLIELFEACFGLRDKGVLPRFLQTEIYGSVK